MTSENLLGSEVQRLLSNLSDHGSQHLTEIETDLAQTTFLLSEAIEKLGASFMAIHETVSAQQQMVAALLAGGTATPEITEKLQTLHGEVGLHVNAAVTGLQFQDMTSQLIGRTIKRVTGLRDLLSTLGVGGSEMKPEDGAQQVVESLDNINKVLEDQSAKLESTLWKAVCQTHMESGDIELF